MKILADLMVGYGLLENARIDELVDDQFARNVNVKGVTDLESILHRKITDS